MIISHKYRFIFIKTAKVGGTSVELFLSDVCGENDVFPPFGEKEKNHNCRNFKGLFNPLPEILFRKRAFGNLGCDGCEITIKDFAKRNKFFEPMPAWQIRARTPKHIWDTYYKFTIERNPWDKAVSRFFHSKAVYEPKYKKELTINGWLDYVEHMLAHPWLNLSWGSCAPYNFPRYTEPLTGELLVDKICRYEKLNSDLGDIFLKLGIPFTGEIKYQAKGSYRKDKRPYQEVLNEQQRYRIEQIFKKEIEMLGYSWQ